MSMNNSQGQVVFMVNSLCRKFVINIADDWDFNQWDMSVFVGFSYILLTMVNPIVIVMLYC